jgi:hypothetical protein
MKKKENKKTIVEKKVKKPVEKVVEKKLVEKKTKLLAVAEKKTTIPVVEKKKTKVPVQPRQVETLPTTTNPITTVVQISTIPAKVKTIRITSGKDSSSDLLTDAQLIAAKEKYSYGALAFALTVKSNRSLRNLFDSIKERAINLNLGKAKRLKAPELATLQGILKTPADVDKWIVTELK